ncbi:MAG: prolipoprotein diacylglyceryl transferase [Bradymonadaceae bacterium]|nr:prolipoprotein diacylglyceryl transferase [Lujinxingiaceae bacterium]
MYPTLFNSSWVGLDGALHFTLSSYFAGIMLGFLVACWIAYRDVRQAGLGHQQFVDFAIWMLIIGVLGSRAAHVLLDGFFFDYVNLCLDTFALEGKSLAAGALCETNQQCLGAQARGMDIGAICRVEEGLCYPQQDCFRWVKFWAGGLTVYGGLLGCAAFAYFYLKRYSVPAVRVMDAGGYGIFIGLFFGRLGCFLAGCCFGGICEIDWMGVQFPTGSLAYQHHFEHHHELLSAQWIAGLRTSLPVYPTQLIESAYALAIFLVVYFYVRPRKRFDGQLILTGGLLYGVCRFGVEFLRDDVRGGLLALSTSQWISLPLIVGCAYLLWRNGRALKPDTEA